MRTPDPDARKWIEKVETVSAVAAQRPVAPVRDVVIIGASADLAIRMYESGSAYVCPSDRSFAEVSYMGFYSDKQILPYFPAIEEKIVPARWNNDEVSRKNDAPIDHKKRGRGSAFVQNKRYFSRAALLAANDTGHLTVGTDQAESDD